MPEDISIIFSKKYKGRLKRSILKTELLVPIFKHNQKIIRKNLKKSGTNNSDQF